MVSIKDMILEIIGRQRDGCVLITRGCPEPSPNPSALRLLR